MIRSSRASLKFTNTGKRHTLNEVIDEYKRVVCLFVEMTWEMEKVPSLLPITITSQVETWLSARLVQCAGKQASGIVRGTREKQERRQWQINKFVETGQFKKARQLQKIYDRISVTKPEIKTIEMELDARFVNVDLNNPTTFDGWLTIASMGKKIKIVIPFKSTKHLNKMLAIGERTSGVRISKEKITFIFEIPEKKSESTQTVGVDIGVKSLLSVDYGATQFQSGDDAHGHNLDKINDKLTRRKKSSKGFRRAQRHRTNYINAQINKMDWPNIGQLNIERIRGMRKGCKTSRKLQHFTYKEIFDKLKLKSEDYGVRVHEINPVYTSQRCSCCGWTRKSNRKGKMFVCGKCGYTDDADTNGSKNIRLPLPSIRKKERLQHKNRAGFYWNVASDEPIVRRVQ